MGVVHRKLVAPPERRCSKVCRAAAPETQLLCFVDVVHRLEQVRHAVTAHIE